MIHGSFIDCVMDIDRGEEFGGDVVAQYTKLVDLGRHYEKLVIMVPTIAAGTTTLQLYVQEGASTATVPYNLCGANSGNSWSTSTITSLKCTTCEALGGHRYLRIKTSINQTADVTFRVMGVRS